MNTRLIIGSLMLAASATLFAQGPGLGQPGGRDMRPCAEEPDPAKCEARRKEMREHMKQARGACKGKEGAERGACMSQQMCAKAPDPAKCQANAKQRMEQRKAHAEKKRERAEKRDRADKRGEKGPAPKN